MAALDQERVQPGDKEIGRIRETEIHRHNVAQVRITEGDFPGQGRPGFRRRFDNADFGQFFLCDTALLGRIVAIPDAPNSCPDQTDRAEDPKGRPPTVTGLYSDDDQGGNGRPEPRGYPDEALRTSTLASRKP